MALEGPRAALIVLLIFFFFLEPNIRGPSLSRLLDLEKRIEHEKAALQSLNSSTYKSFDPKSQRWLNLTGLRHQDNYAWEYLESVQERSAEHLRLATLMGDSNSSNTADHSTTPSQAQPDHDNMAPFREPLPMFSNLTGVVRGKWVRSQLEGTNHSKELNLTSLAPGTSYATSKYSRNITGYDGDIHMNLVDQTTSELEGINATEIRQIKVESIMSDKSSSGDGWDATLYGVHFVRQGSVIVSTTSEKFDGIFALPHFTRSPVAFNMTQTLLAKWLGKTIEKRRALPDASFNPWSSTSGSNADIIFPTPQCELVIYLQQYPPTKPDQPFDMIEHELRYPTGARIDGVPQMHLSAVVFSPDCGFVLESKGPPDFSPASSSHLKGRKMELYFREARYYVLLFAILICSQIFLLKKQMNQASTPSTKSRISFYSVFIMAMGDGLACMGCLFTAMLPDTLSLALIATAFLTFLCVGFCGMKFLTDIWDAQAPERLERARERQRLREERNAAVATAASSAAAPPDTDAGRTSAPDTLPLPVTAQVQNRTPTPVIITPDQDLDAAEIEDTAAAANLNTNNALGAQTALGSARREIGALYVRFYLAVVSILFLSVWATSWPRPVRSLYCNLLAFLYLSFWTPQIYRNVIRNCRKALSWRFVIGQSIVRLAPFGYFYTVDQNVLFVDTDVHTFLSLATWVWLQAFVLAAQEAAGPRIFVPEGWAPKAYDYHPVLREGDKEQGGNMPVGFTDAITSPTSPKAASTSASSATNPDGQAWSNKKDDRHKRTFDCAICTETFDVPVVPATAVEGATAATTLFARRFYMVTPCRHIFHSACLEGWMRYRLQCPTCREMLPPL